MVTYSGTTEDSMVYVRLQAMLSHCLTNDTMVLTGDTMGRQQTNLGTILDVKSSVYFEN